MENITFIDLLLLLGIGQGFLLIFGISKVKNKYNAANRILISILFIATLSLLARVFYTRFEMEWMVRIATFADAAILIIGPLIYFYVKNLVEKNNSSSGRYVHYLPIGLYALYFLWSLSMPIDVYLNLVFREYWFVPYSIELLGLISMWTYWILSYQIVKKGTPEKDSAIMPFVKVFIATVGCICLIWLTSFLFMFIFQKPLYAITYNGIWITICALFYIVGFFSLNKPEILRLKYSKNGTKLENQDIMSLDESLQVLINNEQVYTSTDLDLKGLSTMLETSPNKLSWFLNHSYNTSFYNYINGVRINAFRDKIAQNEHSSKTLLALANEVGFNTKSTFNKAFKTHTNMTPSEYVKKVSCN